MGIAVLDIGTSSMRGIFYDENGIKQFTEQVGYSPIYQKDDWVEQNPEDWSGSMERVMKACASWAKDQGKQIEAVSITSQRSSVIPVGAEDAPLGNAIMWQDKRVLPLLKELAPEQERIFALAGSRINPVFSGPKMMWIRVCDPELYRKVTRLVVIPDYVVHEMTGEWVTDATYASRSLLMNLKTRQWDDTLLQLFKVEREKLCRIVEPGSIVGTVNKSCAERTGLCQGTPVISAGGDQQCAALGMGILRQGDLEVSVGTGAYMIAAARTLPEQLKPDVICNASVVPGNYILESSILSCASVFNWFLRLCYGMTEENRGQVYEQVNAEIGQSLKAADAPLVLPLFQGRGTPDWNSEARGCIQNITLGTERGDIARGILEGLAYEISANVDIIKSYTGSLSQITACGGLANSPAFRRILAGVCGCGLGTYSDNEATAIGAWMSAAVTLGICESYDAAFRQGRQAHPVDILQPEPELAARYQKGRKEYQKLYEQLYGGNRL